jgi:glutathione S-transferase
MHLFMNTTSPYARIARIALDEKGLDYDSEVVDPWADAPQLLEANTAGRVPTLVTDEGRRLAESLLIVLWLEAQRPQPPLLGADRLASVAQAGIAMGVIDAAVHTLIGRKITDASFDESPVGRRRRRSMIDGLRRLESDPPRYDYVRFRFANAAWMPALPQLDGLAARLAERPSFERSRPRA